MTVSHPQPGRGPRAFTLIELFVVIAIVAILAILLFPVFKNAKESANATRCVSNLRRLGEAFSIFITETGQFPFPYYGTGVWYAKLAPVLELPQDEFGSFIDPDHVLTCPADKTPGFNRFAALDFRRLETSYAFNYLTLAPPQALEPIRPAGLSSLSHTPILGDSGASPSNYLMNYNPPPSVLTPGDRHRGGANVLFADGSVRWCRQDELYALMRSPR